MDFKENPYVKYEIRRMIQMNIYEQKMKDNKKMQEFCISKINEISNIEYIFNVKSREPGYVSDIKYINYR